MMLRPTADEILKRTLDLPGMRYVGWLDEEHSSGSAIDEVFLTRLFEMLVEPWQPFAMAGIHECNLCVFSGGPGSVRWKGYEVPLGSNNLFVPSDQCLFVAPSTIVHYIDSHGFVPPCEFVEAVMRCPPMKSMAYFKALKQHMSIATPSTPPHPTT